MFYDILYGLNAIKNILINKPFLLKKIYILKLNARIFNLLKIAENINININFIYIKNIKFQYILKNYNIFCIIQVINKNNALLNILNAKQILLLYQIQDPHNLSACIRSMEAFKFNCLILTGKNTAKITTLIHNLSHATSLFISFFYLNNLKKTLLFFKKNKFNLYAFSIKSKKKIEFLKNNDKFIFILGSEKNGISKSIIKLCNYVYKIPTFGLCDSINLSVAVGIILYAKMYKINDNF